MGVEYYTCVIPCTAIRVIVIHYDLQIATAICVIFIYCDVRIVRSFLRDISKKYISTESI